MNLRLATEEDLGALLQLRHDAREWLRDVGTDQWAADLPTTNTPDEIEVSLDRRETLVIDDLGSVVAAVTVNDRSDPGLWRPWEKRSALFVHRMIVDRSVKSRRLGATLLDVAGRCATLSGRQWLRLDCWTTNTQLHRYYESQGFVHVRTVEGHPWPSAACFQRTATARTGPPLFTNSQVQALWCDSRRHTA